VDVAEDSIAARLQKAVMGDPENAVVKAGTLAVTRGTAALVGALIAGYAIMQVSGWEPWDTLTPFEKILVALAILLLWVLQSSADVLARGIATSKPDPPGLVPLPDGLTVTRTAGRDERGWTAVAVRLAADGDPTEASWLLVKGDQTEWVDGADITFA
jgi:hypothetical protein